MKKMLFGRFRKLWLIINMQCMVSMNKKWAIFGCGDVRENSLLIFLVKILKYTYFLGMFINGFPKLLRLQTHHEKVLKKFLPRLKKHMDKNGIDTGLYTLKWFFQCFLDRVSSNRNNFIYYQKVIS